MQDDEKTLRELNEKIGVAEGVGDKESLARALAPVLAFRRANGECVDRDAFLGQVKPGLRRETEIESVDLLGRDRAIVSCVVTVVDGDQRKRFHNARLFVRSKEGHWGLLGWANEPV